VASQTPNLNLRKPTNNDTVNVTTDLAENFDKIDAHAHSGTYVRWFDVTRYGATGDGTTDDRTAIMAAIAAADAAGGGTVYFPEGTYKIATGLAAQENIDFVGAGQAASIIQLTDGSASTFIVYHGVKANITYRNLGFNGGVQAGPTNSLLFDGTTDFLVENCRFTSMKQAVWLDGTTGPCGRATIRRNRFDTCVDFAVRVENGTPPADVLIEGNYCAGVTVGVTTDEACFARINGARITVRNNFVASSADTGVMVAGSANRDVLVEGNTLRTTLVGVFVGTGAKRTRIVNNDIASTSDFGVHIYDATQVHSETVVANNVIHDCGKSGVEVEGVEGVVVTGNVIERVGTDTGAADNQRAGIGFTAIVAGVKKTTVVGNVIRDDAGSPTMRHGIYYQAASTNTYVVGNSVTNALVANYTISGTLTAPYYIQTDTGVTTSSSTTPVVLSAGALAVYTGSAAAVLQGRFGGWALDAATAEGVEVIVDLPADWQTANVTVLAVNPLSSTGNVVFSTGLGGFADGDAATSAGGSATPVTVAAGAVDIIKEYTLLTGATVPAASALLRVARLGADAADTLANDIVVIGVKITRAS
jgi:hypothetical protein